VAAARGDVEAIKQWVAAGRDVNVEDSNGWYPLHEASRTGEVDALKALVDGGADIGVITHGGGSALWWARRAAENAPDNKERRKRERAVAYLREIGAPDHPEMSDEL
jgi:ankyrin repeat protein